MSWPEAALCACPVLFTDQHMPLGAVVADCGTHAEVWAGDGCVEKFVGAAACWGCCEYTKVLHVQWSLLVGTIELPATPRTSRNSLSICELIDAYISPALGAIFKSRIDDIFQVLRFVAWTAWKVLKTVVVDFSNLYTSSP